MMKKILMFLAAVAVVTISNQVWAEDLEMAETVSISAQDQTTQKTIVENLDYTQAAQSLPAITQKSYKASNEGELRSDTQDLIN